MCNRFRFILAAMIWSASMVTCRCRSLRESREQIEALDDILSAVAAEKQAVNEALANPKAAFRNWKQQHRKQYKTLDVESNKENIFTENLRTIASANAASGPYYANGLGKFMDMTTREFVEMYVNVPIDQRETCPGCGRQYADSCAAMLRHNQFPYANVTASPMVDWSKGERRRVTSAKEQGQCGACATFTAVGLVESLYMELGYGEKDFSELRALQCSGTSFGSASCNGAVLQTVLRDLACMGVVPEYGQPGGYSRQYSGTMADDNEACNRSVVAMIPPVQAVHHMSNVSFKMVRQAVSMRPVGVDMRTAGVQGTGFAGLQFYTSRSGLVPCMDVNPVGDGSSDHSVMLVGYGSEANIPYYILKNSWSEDWGVEGFFLVRTDCNPMGGPWGFHRSMTMLVPQIEREVLERAPMSPESSRVAPVQSNLTYSVAAMSSTRAANNPGTGALGAPVNAQNSVQTTLDPAAEQQGLVAGPAGDGIGR